MLDNEIIRKKDEIENIAKRCKSNIDLINILRTKCDILNENEKDFILQLNDTNIVLNKRSKKVEYIVKFDKSLHKFKKFRKTIDF